MPCCLGTQVTHPSKERGDIEMHVKRITSLASLALLGVLSLPPSGLAADAKEGTAKYTTYWVASSYSPIKLDTDGFAIFDFSGVTSSDNPMFNHLAFHCLG